MSSISSATAGAGDDNLGSDTGDNITYDGNEQRGGLLLPITSLTSSSSLSSSPTTLSMIDPIETEYSLQNEQQQHPQPKHRHPEPFQIESNNDDNHDGIIRSSMEDDDYDHDHDHHHLSTSSSSGINDGTSTTTGGRRRPFFFRYIPICMRYDTSPIEATGCAVDMYARSSLFLVGIFVGPALLELASNEAAKSCGVVTHTTTDDDMTDVNDNVNDVNNDNINNDNTGDQLYYDETCLDTARVYGFKPSSLLTNMGMIAAFLSAVSLPPTGAIVDYTYYRRHLGLYTAGALTLIKVVELSLSQNTWFVVACLQVVAAMLYQIHTTVVYAYSSELSNEATKQSSYQTNFFIVMYISMLLYMVQVLVPGQLLNLSDVGSARLAILVSCLICVPLFSLSWLYLFRDKPPVCPIPSGQSLWTAGFRKLYHTYTDIAMEYKAVNVFLLTIAFSEAADTALATIATTYMSEYLGFSGLEIGMVILTVLVAGVPGTLVGDFLTQRHDNPIRSAQVCLIMYIGVTAAASIYLRPDTTKILTYVFGALWGMCQGWMHPQHTTTFVTITPHQKGKGETEMMGLYLFFTQILGFLPPMVFTILNESGYSMRLGMSTLILYFIIGLVGLVAMGDFNEARRRANN